MTDPTRGRFVVQAGYDCQLTLEHWQPDGAVATDPWCHWETTVSNGTSLPELDRLAADHLARDHRTVIDLDATAVKTTAGSAPQATLRQLIADKIDEKMRTERLDDHFDGHDYAEAVLELFDGPQLRALHAPVTGHHLSDVPAAPNAHIQWKGTDVCLDLRCTCGQLSHYDGGFAYAVRCAHCGRVYPMPTTLPLAEGDPEWRHVVTTEADDPQPERTP